MVNERIKSKYDGNSVGGYLNIIQFRRFDVLPREDGKAAEMVGRALPEIPVNPRESAAKLPQ